MITPAVRQQVDALAYPFFGGYLARSGVVCISAVSFCPFTRENPSRGVLGCFLAWLFNEQLARGRHKNPISMT